MLVVNPLCFTFCNLFFLKKKITWWLAADPPSPADHLRDVFYRMGLSDKVILMVIYTWFLDITSPCMWYFPLKLFFVQEIVALSGAHTLGRSRPERSGWGKPETKYTVLYTHLLCMTAEEHILTKLHISYLWGDIGFYY